MLRVYQRAATLMAMIAVSFLASSALLPAVLQSGARIEGVVIDSERGMPIADVTVQANGPSSHSTRTDTNGHFLLGGLSAGRYQVATTSERYAPVRDSARTLPGNSGLWITVDVGERVADLTLSLKRWGVVTGRIRDANGDAVQRALATAVRKG